MTRNVIYALFSVVCLLASNAGADIVAEFSPSANEVSNSTIQSSDSSTSTTVSPYDTRSDQLGPKFDEGHMEQRSMFRSDGIYMSAGATTATANPQISNGYHEFKFTVDEGTWNLDKISFDYWVTDTYAGGRFYSRVHTDRTNFDNTGDLLGGYEHIGVEGNEASTHIQRVEVDLAPFMQHQNLRAGDEVEFRIYFADFTSNDAREHHVDNILLEANPASVPEPGSAAVLFGLMMLTAIRRRR